MARRRCGGSVVDTDGIVFDKSVRYHVRITKTGDRLHFDFSGSNDQVQGPINIFPSQACAALYYALVSFVSPHPPINGGVRRVAETTFRPGSVVCANYPCASGMYMASTTAVAEAVLQGLSQFVPSNRHGLNGGTGGNVFGGTRPDGSPFIQYELIASAYGGSVDLDGASGVTALLTNANTAPIEILENEFPTRLERFELIPDSGGVGRFRGGLAPRRYYRILANGLQWTLRGGRNRVRQPASWRPCRLGAFATRPGERNRAAEPLQQSRMGDVGVENPAAAASAMRSCVRRKSTTS